MVPKKWSHAKRAVDFDKKKNYSKNLDRDQIWLMWVCKWGKITHLKVRDKKLFYKCEKRFKWFS